MHVSRTTLIIRRIGAWLLDTLLAFGAWFALALLGLGRGEDGMLLMQLLYFPLFEYLMRGQTPGKLLLGLSVINRAGQPPSLLQALLRGITRPIEAAFGLIVVWLCAESRYCQRPGDWLARTYVMDTRDLRALRQQLSEG
ncbi:MULTISPECIES: RDD family protein [Pseudomonas]|uniref:RDD family protein n=1 Tax=Pseudomonas donghuensis TaxID=1163398 RepID=A0AAP0XBH2_9PSED|nr:MULTISPECIES: RDD family protein [Pseudomonas]MDF9892950.1 putative RDD family membrane protein YckC [Pseudomonas vranovensis]KDO00948.1 RDD family protein [Pseudomonas donghuensis]MBF4207044.1 RDD family protein [Pseudomonas donghuensis]MBS7600603.1 RDD family protein [Pseudomonas sp. RC2C2]MCP3751541.1 RDD family protein [Pseudomonas sp. SBB6]